MFPLRRVRAMTIALAAICALGCAGASGGGNQETKMGHNRLGNEKSPYLLQHKDNPVWWYAWGPEAFAAAKERNLPVFLSIGYSTCHWCHVMEHESFENEEVAAYLNEHFIPIKVDREERPDIDAIYMDAVQAMTGRGGWPMSSFLTPEGKPFFGGTYYPKARFLTILEHISETWQDNREGIEADAKRLMAHIDATSTRGRAGKLDQELLLGLLEKWNSSFDPIHGGSRGAPKFPESDELRVLLRVHRRAGGDKALMMVRTTLDEMARGGIYDHLGGGFARYSTDDEWLVPHFEKMLYDQASLTMAYLEAWQVTGEKEYELVVRETLDYVLRDMRHPGGAFYSAEDADSDGDEGKFYVWTESELKSLLDEKDYAAFANAFGVSAGGNFEHHTNILNLQKGHNRAGRSRELAASMKKLFAIRDQRVHPHLDDKILSDWNGLMIGAMARAGRMLGEPRYVEAAATAARFIVDHSLDEQGAILHRWRDNTAGIPGFLEDYAYFVHALIELYQADFDPTWLTLAKELQDLQETLFRDEKTGDYFTTDGRDKTVLLRRSEVMDNVRPAGRSVAALNLLRLADLLLEDRYSTRASRIFSSTPAVVMRVPQAFGHLLLALDYAADRSKEVAIIGEPQQTGTQAMIKAINTGFRPNLVLASGNPSGDSEFPPLLAKRPMKEGLPTAYVCENQVCKLPTTDPAKASDLADTFEKLAKSATR